MRLLIKNAKTTEHLLGIGSSVEVKVNVLIEDGDIIRISRGEIPTPDCEEIDASGLFLSPGLCDPQVHFREPGLEYKEDIASGSRAAVKGGFTHVISMPNTTPTADNYDTVKFMHDKSEEVGLCYVYPTGAVTKGLQGKELNNFAELKDAGAIAITDDGKGIQSEEMFKKAMAQASKEGLSILDHSEDESLSAGGCIHLGEVSAKYDLKGIDSKSESVHVKRGCELSEQTGCHYHVLHISTKESLAHVKEAKARGVNVTCEVSPHHLLLCDESIPEKEDGSLNANWKMNPPLRSKEDREACQLALINGEIDAIATDHAPHSPDEKAMEIGKAPFGIIGLETAFPLIYTNFVETKKLSLDRCIDLMSKQAGELFGLEIGRIKEGQEANLTLLNLNDEFTITEDFFASKSKNSPFIGEKLKGKTAYTIFKGNIVYKDS